MDASFDFEPALWSLIVDIPEGRFTTVTALASKIGPPASPRNIGKFLNSGSPMLYPIHMILSHHGKPESGLYRLRYRRDPAEDGPLLEAMGIKLAGHYVAKESRHLFWDGWP